MQTVKPDIELLSRYNWTLLDVCLNKGRTALINLPVKYCRDHQARQIAMIASSGNRHKSLNKEEGQIDSKTGNIIQNLIFKII